MDPGEVAILQQYYPTEGIACQKRLPNRNQRAIQLYAQSIGMRRSSRTWSVEENEILRKNSPLSSKALQELLPGRTSAAIDAQKAQLGLTKKTSQPWSSEEDALLRHYYPIEGLKCKNRLPNRTEQAIQKGAVFFIYRVCGGVAGYGNNPLHKLLIYKDGR